MVIIEEEKEEKKDTYQKPLPYRPEFGMPELPPQLYSMKFQGKSVDEVAKELKKLPFFMTDINDQSNGDDDDEDTLGKEQMEALQALAYDGDPEEVAGNFKKQGNEQYKQKRYKDAVVFYTKAIAVENLGVERDPKDVNGEEFFQKNPEKAKQLAKEAAQEGRDIKLASLANRAACNLELKNYRRCITDCRKVLAELDPKHEKCIFRAAKALIAVERYDEAIDLLTYGKTAVPSSTSIPPLLKTAEEKYEKKVALVKRRKEEEERKATAKRNLETAINAHGFKLLNSVNSEVDETGASSGVNSLLPSGVRIHLEDPMNPASELIVPVMFLYPLDMQSDMMEAVDVENTPVSAFLEQLFGESLPPWVSASAANLDYADVKKLDVYCQTDSGGLVKVGRNSTLNKIFSLKQPVVPIIDGVPRLYVVPRNRAKDWLSTWDKNHAKYLLYGD